jgi:hypothetical protein
MLDNDKTLEQRCSQGCTPVLDERFAVGSPRTIAKTLRE